jgi:hypothetical protein
VFRAITNSLLSLFMVATFMWGGCVSCEQYFMFPGKQLRSCCNKSGQCERPGKVPTKPQQQDCNRLPLGPGGSAHQVHPPPAVPAVIAEFVSPYSSSALRVAAFDVLLEPSPPDLQVLHATFLI